MNAVESALHLPLPAYRHQPGINTRPPEDFLTNILGAAANPATIPLTPEEGNSHAENGQQLSANTTGVSTENFPVPVSDDNWTLNITWCYGIRLINEGFYWEAHEALEPVWMSTSANTREQYLTQGVIQLANCALKKTMQKPAAARKLGILTRECLQRAFPGSPVNALMGLYYDELLQAIDIAVDDGQQFRLSLVRP